METDHKNDPKNTLPTIFGSMTDVYSHKFLLFINHLVNLRGKHFVMIADIESSKLYQAPQVEPVLPELNRHLSSIKVGRNYINITLVVVHVHTLHLITVFHFPFLVSLQLMHH